MAFKVRAKKGVKINRVITKIVITVLGLYVGGTIMSSIGGILKCTANPFNSGMALIGYTVKDNAFVNTTGSTYAACNSTAYPQLGTGVTVNGLITDVNGTGILAVIGIVGIASVVTEFVEFSL